MKDSCFSHLFFSKVFLKYLLNATKLLPVYLSHENLGLLWSLNQFWVCFFHRYTWARKFQKWKLWRKFSCNKSATYFILLFIQKYRRGFWFVKHMNQKYICKAGPLFPQGKYNTLQFLLFLAFSHINFCAGKNWGCKTDGKS